MGERKKTVVKIFKAAQRQNAARRSHKPPNPQGSVKKHSKGLEAGGGRQTSKLAKSRLLRSPKKARAARADSQPTKRQNGPRRPYGC